MDRLRQTEAEIQRIQPDHYIPSAPLAALAPIHLSDLQPHSRAQGRVLHGVLSAEPRKLRNSIQVLTMFLDSNGDSVTLGIKHAIRGGASQEEVRAAFPLGARVAIKEPTLDDSIENRAFISLDNPANLVVISYLSDSQLEIFRGISPAEIRAHGNELFKAGSFESAAQAYGLSFNRAKELEQVDPRDQILALSNQAECMLKLGRFEECIDVADGALALDPNYYKAIYRKGSALIQLHLYDWASTFLKNSTGMHESIEELHSKAQKLAEQSHSSTSVLQEIARYVERATTVAPPVNFPELAEYVGPVEIRMCPDQRFNRGRGMFATRDIVRGEVVLVNNSVIFQVGTDRDKVVRLLDVAMKSSRGYQQVYSLARPGGGVPDMKIFTPNWITAEEWSSYRGSINRELLQGIDVKKAYEIESLAPLGEAPELHTSDQVTLSGKALLACLINHSCVPNICRRAFDETLCFIASREIAAGEEIVLSYFPTDLLTRIPMFDLKVALIVEETYTLLAKLPSLPDRRVDGDMLSMDSLLNNIFPTCRGAKIESDVHDAQIREPYYILKCEKQAFQMSLAFLLNSLRYLHEQYIEVLDLHETVQSFIDIYLHLQLVIKLKQELYIQEETDEETPKTGFAESCQYSLGTLICIGIGREGSFLMVENVCKISLLPQFEALGYRFNPPIYGTVRKFFTASGILVCASGCWEEYQGLEDFLQDHQLENFDAVESACKTWLSQQRLRWDMHICLLGSGNIARLVKQAGMSTIWHEEGNEAGDMLFGGSIMKDVSVTLREDKTGLFAMMKSAWDWMSPLLDPDSGGSFQYQVMKKLSRWDDRCERNLSRFLLAFGPRISLRFYEGDRIQLGRPVYLVSAEERQRRFETILMRIIEEHPGEFEPGVPIRIQLIPCQPPVEDQLEQRSVNKQVRAISWSIEA